MEKTITNHKSNLIVYKASAGSGKTFTLVSEYIALAIEASLRLGCSQGKAAYTFGKILAITFTNKATTEMKMRILNTLYNISHNNATTQAYVKKISELTGSKYDNKTITDETGNVLRSILHNYDSFEVKTIDAFYRNIIGNIALMVGFHSNLEVYMDNDTAISNAVDTIVNGMAFGNDKDKKRYLDLLNKYIDRNIEEETSWDFRRSLKQFGQNICKEVYMMNSEKITEFFENSKTSNEFLRKLQELKAKCEKIIVNTAEGFLATMKKHGVSFSDINGGGNVEKYLQKLIAGGDVNSSKTRITHSEVPEKWIFKESNDKYRPEIVPIIRNTIFPAFVNLEKSRRTLQYTINSVDFTLKNMSDLRMLSMIDEEVKRESKENNRILLSKSQELIKGEIRSDEDMSFVFEHAGKQYKNIMLDEAQDTSGMQWENLRNFLSNTMSNIDGRCVVVGDIKQSIYRWRNSDWRILESLVSKSAINHFKAGVETHTLEQNFRSEANIVSFNGKFFKSLAHILSIEAEAGNMEEHTTIEDLYADVVQQSSKDEQQGFVKIDTITLSSDKKIKAKDKIAKIDDVRLQILTDNIEKLHSEGLPYSQMAILVRYNKDLKTICDFVTEHDLPFKVNTNEAYNVVNAKSVKMIVSAIGYLNEIAADKTDMINATYVAFEYQKVIHGSAFDEQSFYDDIVPDKSNRKTNPAKSDAYIPPVILKLPDRLQHDCAYLNSLPLKELCLELIDILCINKIENESAYVYTFLDYIENYTKTNAYDLDLFLEDWETDGYKQKISASDSEGVQGITIHKAKGLEFHTVFVPYCDWNLVRKRNEMLLWCEPTEEPYDEMPLVPIKYNADVADSIYAADYHKENYNIIVDNLNTLYVALTRAKKNLYIELEETIRTEKLTNDRISSSLISAVNDADLNFDTDTEIQIPCTNDEDAAEKVIVRSRAIGKALSSFNTANNPTAEPFSINGKAVTIPIDL